MKKSIFTFDFVNKSIVGSKHAIKKAGNPLTDEYKELCKMMSLQPTFSIVAKEEDKTREKKSTKKKETYEGLTFAMMGEYINTLPENEKLIADFEEVKRIAKNKYPVVKKWFLETYKDFTMKKAKSDISSDRINKIKIAVSNRSKSLATN